MDDMHVTAILLQATVMSKSVHTVSILMNHKFHALVAVFNLILVYRSHLMMMKHLNNQSLKILLLYMSPLIYVINLLVHQSWSPLKNAGWILTLHIKMYWDNQAMKVTLRLNLNVNWEVRLRLTTNRLAQWRERMLCWEKVGWRMMNHLLKKSA
jgi:hypothetical protein